MKRLVIFLLLIPVMLNADKQLFRLLNNQRLKSGLPALQEDIVLNRTARDYSLHLRQEQVLSHQGKDGENALRRYRDRGGTAPIVGEIIGFGSSLDDIVTAWLESRPHRDVLLKPEWTHMGYGYSSVGEALIVVGLFAIQHIDDLTLKKTGSVLVISGHLSIPGRPLLIAGIERRMPERTQPETGMFRFEIPVSLSHLYHRLGVLDGEGHFTLISAFFPERVLTSSEEREPR